MIIKAVDLGLKRELIGEVNPLKKNIKIIKKEPKICKKVYGFPSSKSTFRKYSFPFKDRSKIEKAVRTQLQMDLPFPVDQIEYSYFERYEKNRTEIFCVIVRKEDLQKIKDGDIIDSEIFALLRLAKYNGLNNCEILHFSEGYSVYLKIKDQFIDQVRVFSQKPEIDDNFYLSGNIPEDISSNRILKNPTDDPSLNVAFGLLLRGVDDTGIDLLHRSEELYTEKILKGAVYLTLAVVLFNLALIFRLELLERQLRSIKEKEKELFVKGFNYTGEVFDPLEQAKGKIASLKASSVKKEDAVDILDFIGRSKRSAGISRIYRISITSERFVIQGIAYSIKDVERFKNGLNSKYEANIDETVSTPEGMVRFSISGVIR
ncbi:MAG TPA: hypothetical protein DEP48_05420 [Persephonella sp.]|uniref:General secretion pathway protein L n=1 Tax=Persephonella marina (strain DSM 14350 / EX-H1) TaxID=123214 RepID=C0QPK9_PERMH|nr:MULTISPECIES: hypothetical protein [Persephonella]ACO04417.1 hypothetical protein PERMA_0818 [Persephonella marina EX-H1]HCB69780.1 hypothetical protein [Persephonella sp.]